MKSGMSEAGNSNEKVNKKYKWIVLILLLAISLIIVAFVLAHFEKSKNSYSFDQVEKVFFEKFNFSFPDQKDYEFHSLDAYCIEDENIPDTYHYFVDAKYKAYFNYSDDEDDNGWYEIEEVHFGRNGLDAYYCLNWDNIEGFEKENELFNKAVKEGHHKSYTQEEIQKLIEENPYVIE